MSGYQHMKSFRPIAQYLVWSYLVLAGLASASLAADVTEPSAREYLYQSYTQPINPDLYLIRPGEHIVVTFVGSHLTPIELIVGQEGKLVHSALGTFDLSSKTLSQTRKLLLGPLQAQYNARQIDISVGPPYRVTVAVTGAVMTPGYYQAYTSQRVSELITAAGGIRPDGSFRRVRFTAADTSREIDLDRVLNVGDLSGDLRMYAGYQIFVPNRSRDLVQVVGEVNRSREIELLPTDSLGLLLQLAGGLTTNADPSAIHVLGDSTHTLSMNAQLHPGDIIVVPTLPTAAGPSLTVIGEVNHPGRYTFRDSMTLGELIAMAGGTIPRANNSRITVFRQAEPDEAGRRVETRYAIARPADGSADFSKTRLMPTDSVVVPAKLGYVRVSGMVRNPGLYPFEAGKPALFYIESAGGFATDANRKEITFFDRLSRLTVRTTPDVVASDGDEITVIPAEVIK